MRPSRAPEYERRRRYSLGLRCAACDKPRTNGSKKYCGACFKPDDNFNPGLRCNACGGPRAKNSKRYCKTCSNLLGYEAQDGGVAGHRKSSEWSVDEMGCMTRLHGDLAGL